MSRTFYFLSSRYFKSTSSLKLQKQSFQHLSSDNGHDTKITSGRWRRFWRSWVPIPTSVGITVLAVLQWRRLQRRSKDEDYKPAKGWEITCYRAVPCRAFSRAWGWLSNRHLPGPLRSWIYGFYASMYGVNLDEMAGDLTDYPSLAEFFTRELKQGLRPIDTSCIVSPADGRVLNCGKINSCRVEQVKGVTYKIQTFLGESSWRPSTENNKFTSDDDKTVIKKGIKPIESTDENENEVVSKSKDDSNNQLVPQYFWGGVDIVRYLFKARQELDECIPEDWEEYRKTLLINPENELYQAVVYLAPGDYHRFHSPVQWQVNFRRHFQGELLSVNPMIAGWVPELFSLNERVVYVGEWEHGFFSMTAVGATNVGSIRVNSDKTLHTNQRKWRDGTRHKDRVMNVKWSKGEEVGEFRMGSTIVLIFEGPKDFVFNFCSEQKIKVGQSLCCLSQSNEQVR